MLVLPNLFETGHQFVTVTIRQSQIQQNDLELTGLERRPGRRSVRTFRHAGSTGFVKHVDQTLPHHRLIFDHQYSEITHYTLLFCALAQ